MPREGARVRAIVRLTTMEEGSLVLSEIIAAGLEDGHEAVRVMTAPTPEQLEHLLGCMHRW